MRLQQMIFLKELWSIIVKIIYTIVINAFNRFQNSIIVENVIKDIIIIDNQGFVWNALILMTFMLNAKINIFLKMIKI